MIQKAQQLKRHIDRNDFDVRLTTAGASASAATRAMGVLEKVSRADRITLRLAALLR